MAQCNCQGVGGIDLWLLGQFEQVHDHHLHLFLVRPARTGNRLLDLSRRVLGNLQPLLGGGDNGRATRLAKL